MERKRDERGQILKQKGRGVFTTTSDKSLLDIAKLLQQHGIGCIVIVGDDKIAGIVSERDLLRAIGQAGPKVLEQPVSDFMTKTVITARETNTVDRLMSAPVPSHARGGERPAGRPRLHWRSRQDLDLRNRDGGWCNARVHCLASVKRSMSVPSASRKSKHEKSPASRITHCIRANLYCA